MKKIALIEAHKILSSAPNSLNIIDLGCGSAGMIIPLAKAYPQHHFIGYEWNPMVFRLARHYTKSFLNITIIQGDFMQAPISEQNLVLCFACNEISEQLSTKLLQELPCNATVISSAFRLHCFDICHEITAKTCVFIPLKVFVYKTSPHPINDGKRHTT